MGITVVYMLHHGYTTGCTPSYPGIPQGVHLPTRVYLREKEETSAQSAPFPPKLREKPLRRDLSFSPKDLKDRLRTLESLLSRVYSRFTVG